MVPRHQSGANVEAVSETPRCVCRAAAGFGGELADAHQHALQLVGTDALGAANLARDGF